MSALGQGGVTILSGENHGQLAPIAIPAGQSLTFNHGLNRRAFQVLVSSGADANFGQILMLPISQPVSGGEYNQVVVQNDTQAEVQVFVACRWEENSVELSLIAADDSRISVAS